MTYEEYNAIVSEIKELDALLEETPVANAIDRMGLTARLEAAKRQMKGVAEACLTHKARLTFRGRPVYGSHGIAADFAARAAGAFTDAVAAAAAGLSEGLRYMGPIPDKQKNQLLITGTAIGSFGFELEVPPPEKDDMFPEQSKTDVALTKMLELLRLSAEGSDDEVAEVVEAVHPRAVRKVADFLDYIVQQEASCAIEFRERRFRFADPGQVEAAASRLREDNIHEQDEQFAGEFQGVLPASRTFEFRVAQANLVLRGKVGPEIEDADCINREFLHHPARVTLHVIQVGQGRPRYMLRQMANIARGLS